MKQPCASAARLKAAGPFYRRHRSHSSGLNTPTPDRDRQLATRVQPCAETLLSHCPFLHALRMRLPLSGLSQRGQPDRPGGRPQHNALRDLAGRDHAPQPSSSCVRPSLSSPGTIARAHCPYANNRKRHASWIKPRRTRALPDLASPFSRRPEPVEGGAAFLRRAGDASVPRHGS
jgi:hypothetical protein